MTPMHIIIIITSISSSSKYVCGHSRVLKASPHHRLDDSIAHCSRGLEQFCGPGFRKCIPFILINLNHNSTGA